jgi:tripartite-type tricarboxylate transporter receptor subunit TctC
VCGEYFATAAGVKITHIPYKGSSPALTDLVGGHVAIYFSSLPPAVGLVKEGKVRALAVTSAKRSAIFPDLPTVAEAALPGYEAVLHYGIVAPAGTPRTIVDKLGAALRAAVMSDDLKSRLAERRAAPVDPRGICRRHRSRRDQMVGNRAEIRRQGGVIRSRVPIRSASFYSSGYEKRRRGCDRE